MKTDATAGDGVDEHKSTDDVKPQQLPDDPSEITIPRKSTSSKKKGDKESDGVKKKSKKSRKDVDENEDDADKQREDNEGDDGNEGTEGKKRKSKSSSSSKSKKKKREEAESDVDEPEPAPTATLTTGEENVETQKPAQKKKREILCGFAADTIKQPPEGETLELPPLYKCRMGGCGGYYHLECVKTNRLTNTVGMKEKTYVEVFCFMWLVTVFAPNLRLLLCWRTGNSVARCITVTSAPHLVTRQHCACVCCAPTLCT